ncbi:MAG: hypothetical protein BKP49_09755 [Treponema sp. CETP13]|nr:MAG: hypothetical protein BKP49_09755 [Treponema sp. CETP13]
MDYEDLAKQLIKSRIRLLDFPLGESMFLENRGERMVMGFLTHEKEVASPSVLASKCQVSTARIACILNSLEKKGLICRKTDSNDKRKINVRATQKGYDMGKLHERNVVSNTKKLLEFLGEKDAKEHVRIMKRVSDYIVQQTLNDSTQVDKGKKTLC